MTPEEYWDGDVWLVEYYRKAEELRQKRLNAQAWLQGAYVYDAIGRLSPILKPFVKKAKPQPYPARPYGDKEAQPEISPEQRAENERLKAILFFKNWASAAKKQFE